MRKLNAKFNLILISILAISFVMIFTNVVNAETTFTLQATDIVFTHSEDQVRDFNPEEFTALQLVVGKQEEFENRIVDLRAEDRAQYDSQKAAFEAEEDAKFAADNTYVVKDYPEYVNPVVENYSNLFSTDATNYTYAEIISSSTNQDVSTVGGVQVVKSTINVLYRLVTLNVIGGGQQISTVNLTIKAPEAGTSMQAEQVHTEYGDYTVYKPEPIITLENGANYDMSGTYYITAYPSQLPEGYDEPFTGTFVEGQEYYVEVYLTPKAGYTFAPNVTLVANGILGYEPSAWNFENQFMFYAKVKAVAPGAQNQEPQAQGPVEDPRVLNGGHQTANPSVGDKLTFRFDMLYANYLASGKVYVDGNLVPPEYIVSAEGSTIITFTDEYAKALSVGSHTITIAAAGDTISTEFTVASTPGNGGAAVGGSASQDSAGTAAKATSNPKTGDNIVLFVVMFTIAIVGSVVAIKKYRK